MRIPFFKVINPEEYQIVFEGFDMPKSFEELLANELAQLPSCKHLYIFFRLKNKLLFPKHYVGSSREVLKLLINEIQESIKFTQAESEMLFRCCFLRTRNTFSVFEGMKMAYGETGWLFSAYQLMRIGTDRFSIWFQEQN